jgi:hypothetical protein
MAHGKGRYQLPVEGSHVCGPPTEKQVTVCYRHDHVSVKVSPITENPQLRHQLSQANGKECVTGSAPN